MKRLLTLVLAIALIIGLSSNTDVISKFKALTVVMNTTPTLPATPYDYDGISLPTGYTDDPDISGADNTPGDNAITDAGATLGRVLFYDVNLSNDNTISCASCHVQSSGFGDPNQFSTGVNGTTGRNSPGLSNGRYYQGGQAFLDERAASLEDQALMPIVDPVEMGMASLAALVTKLEAVSYYPDLFNDAFGSTEITSEKIGKAIAQFERSMLSYQSKFDIGFQANGNSSNGNFSNFTTEENTGKQLFNQNCRNCHSSALQISDNFRNIGLDVTYADNGVGAHTGNTNHDGKFKVPSLRNIEMSAPYMHDGRFSTLEEVVEFYNSGIQNHANLHNSLKDGANPEQLNLTTEQKAALVAFLKTLTDNTFLTDIRFSDPFSAALPVEWVAFEISMNEDETCLLEWTTTSEYNNDFFVVERSRDGFNFEILGQVEAKGDAYSLSDYQFTDDRPMEGINYYRIKQVDFDGKLTFSNVVNAMVTFNQNTIVEVYPSPATHQVFIKTGRELEIGTTIMILDYQGRIVKTMPVVNGGQQINVDISDLSPGIYILQMEGITQAQPLRFVKQ